METEIIGGVTQRIQQGAQECVATNLGHFQIRETRVCVKFVHKHHIQGPCPYNVECCDGDGDCEVMVSGKGHLG